MEKGLLTYSFRADVHGLEGYAEYKKKVKYRILPFIW